MKLVFIFTGDSKSWQHIGSILNYAPFIIQNIYLYIFSKVNKFCAYKHITHRCLKCAFKRHLPSKWIPDKKVE